VFGSLFVSDKTTRLLMSMFSSFSPAIMIRPGWGGGPDPVPLQIRRFLITPCYPI